MKVINMAIDALIPYENNPRDNSSAVEHVAASIREFGFKVPIIVDRENVIITGHTRLLAAKFLGLSEVPVIVAEDLTEEKVKAFRLADNKVSEFSEWDEELLKLELEGLTMDMEVFGFTDAADMEMESEPEDDNFDVEEALQAEPVTKPGDIYVLGNHRLMCGDSTSSADVKALCDGAEVDLMVTDPPYNVDYEGTAGKIMNDSMADAEFRKFLKSAFKIADSVLKPGGAFYIWHADLEGYNFRGACKDVGWKVRQAIIWNKNALVLGRQDYQWKHEPCLYGWKEGAGHHFIDKRNLTTVIADADPDGMNREELIKLIQDLQKYSTVINENKPSRSELHPTMKPIPLMARNVLNSSRKGEAVLDLFGGSGSVLMACEQLSRRCFTMELDPKFCDVIVARWESYTGRKAVLLNGQ